jgi:hypothetical protein
MSRPWTVEDIEMLSSLAGDIPWPLVPGRFNNSRPRRTATALRRKAEELGLLRRCVGQYITSGALRALMGVSYERARRWILSGQLPARRWGQGRAFPYWIHRRDLRAFARERPELFGGLSEGQLVELLDSEPLAAEIAAMELPRPRQCVAVQCIETGRRYASIKAAARAAYVTPQRMAVVLAHGTTANGRRYRRTEAA